MSIKVGSRYKLWQDWGGESRLVLLKVTTIVRKDSWVAGDTIKVWTRGDITLMHDGWNLSTWENNSVVQECTKREWDFWKAQVNTDMPDQL